ncbi:chromosomal replication initiator DnaA [Frigidibacter sp. MR17.24]|uniref:chromosomal replication initiator DnaA n=1 Tax=Frigidibacter sp. MR17.24 TaxID=3127345 RepID=UPI00301315A0
MPNQLALDLPLAPAMGREAFIPAPSNAVALRQVDDWAHWPAGKLALCGPEGSGKSHLAHLWAEETGAELVPARELALADLPELAQAGRVVVEDADAIAGYGEGERALFHLHNMVMAEGGRLMVTGRAAPSRWGIVLPDLASRMQATATAELLEPDDRLLSMVLVKLFADRQIAAPAALIPWLVARMDRSLAAAGRLVERLDREALARGRPVGRAIAQAVLAEGL